MPKREELLELATWVHRVADAEIELQPATLRALARDIELIATRDAWVPHTLIALAVVAFGIALARLLPADVFQLRPHFFGNEGAALVGVAFLVSGLLLRK